jgi:hypothetical protein
MVIDVDWRQPFNDYIHEQKVPTDKNLAEQLIRRAKSYVLVGDTYAGQQGLPTSFLLAHSSGRC